MLKNGKNPERSDLSKRSDRHWRAPHDRWRARTAHKASWWRPVVVVGNDPFDPASQKKTGPVTTIEENQVVDTYTVSALDSTELAAVKSAAVDSVNGLLKPLLKILMDHENRIRAQHAPPQSALNMADFKTYFKTLL